MPKRMQSLIDQYVEEIKRIYGSHVKQIILYGSYARGDFRPDSDVDIMILVDMSDLELKAYGQQLSYMTYDFNMDHDLDIKPIAKSEAHFNKWIVNYPFYSNIHKEGVVLYGTASGEKVVGAVIKLSSFFVIWESQDWTENRILDIFWTYPSNITEILQERCTPKPRKPL